MNKTVDKEIKGLLKRMQDNRQHWRHETNKKTDDEITRLLKRMQFKRRLLTDNPNATPNDWEALANEYKEKRFLANAASCRTRAKQMRKQAAQSERELMDWTV